MVDKIEKGGSKSKLLVSDVMLLYFLDFFS